MAKQQFKTTLKPAGPGGAWTGIFLTEAQSAKLGRRGRVPVALTVDGHPFKAFAAPMGDDTHGIVFNKTMQKTAGVSPNDVVAVTLEVDTAPRTVEVPPELTAGLKKSKAAKTFFDGLAYTHKKDFVSWITEAKRPETKDERLAETIRLLKAGIKWKDK
ncbi:MAG: YdeI/OmpD-associated family protein [Acidobacteria bacterium]|nr:YdeI/OmpD-associated family protein [Acidobacteriota bacterium]